MWTWSDRNANNGRQRFPSSLIVSVGVWLSCALVSIPHQADFCDRYPWQACANLRDQAGQLIWKSENEGQLRALFSSVEKVNQFICTFQEGDEGEKDSSFPLSDKVREKEDLDYRFVSYVEDFTFLDLYGDGRLELLGIDDNGGVGAEHLVIVEQVANRFNLDEIPNETEINWFREVLLKEEGSAHYCLIGREILEWPEGWCHADPLPVFPHVYEWNGKEWVEADAKHKDYYAKVVLPPLEAELAQGPCPDEEETNRAKCRYSLQKEIAAVKALLAAP